MRWEDERWVKVYTRDTGEWLALGWEAQALFLFALRKADRAGILKTGKMRTRGLAGMTGMPLDVVERVVPLLLEDGCLRETDGGYVIPNFLAAQEALTSASQRKRDQRERARDRALADGMPDGTSGMVIESMAQKRNAANVTPARHASTSQHIVTPEGHAQEVTPRVDETRVDESRRETDLFPAVASAPQRPKAARKPRGSPDKPTDPRHAPLVKALVEEQGWEFGGGRGAKAVTALLAAADEAPATRGEAAPAEVLRRAANALEKRRVAPTAFPAVAALWELAQHWAHFATAPGRATGHPDGLSAAPPDECTGCGRQGQGGSVGDPEVWLGYECGCLGAFQREQSEGLHFTKAQEWARKRRANEAA